MVISDEFRKQKKLRDLGVEGIQIDTQKNKENKHDLIERNKNIFLVAQMLSIKHDEIQKLEDFQTLRDEGLKFSESHLNSDIKQFIEFFKENREKSNMAIKEADFQTKEKQELLAKKKEIGAKYQEFVSEISKNIEKLEVYAGYRTFLMEIYSRRQLEFKKSDQGFEGFNFHPKTNKFGEVPDIQIKPHIKELIENEDLFKSKIREGNLLGEDFFADMEEKNLFLIQQLQDAVQNLESKKNQSDFLQRKFNREVNELESRQTEIDSRLGNAEIENYALQIDGKVLDLNSSSAPQSLSLDVSLPKLSKDVPVTSKFSFDDLKAKI